MTKPKKRSPSMLRLSKRDQKISDEIGEAIHEMAIRQLLDGVKRNPAFGMSALKRLAAHGDTTAIEALKRLNAEAVRSVMGEP